MEENPTLDGIFSDLISRSTRNLIHEVASLSRNIGDLEGQTSRLGFRVDELKQEHEKQHGKAEEWKLRLEGKMDKIISLLSAIAERKVKDDENREQHREDGVSNRKRDRERDGENDGEDDGEAGEKDVWNNLFKETDQLLHAQTQPLSPPLSLELSDEPLSLEMSPPSTPPSNKRFRGENECERRKNK